MILEAVMLHIKPGLESDFEATFKKASKIISSMDGYLSHELHRCIEVQHKYLLLVRWESLESHTVGFRSSTEYQEWKKLLHHFYEPFSTVEHFEEMCDSLISEQR
ncbi:antibiotic biosynthesis monooxygenase family protein [Nostoc sp.]|uniref:antibiotic biosynthesis monooxygenase family protein n=1 Tax=Nostoc sp. TaxID=1180 RepID=UPI002FF907A4